MPFFNKAYLGTCNLVLDNLTYQKDKALFYQTVTIICHFLKEFFSKLLLEKPEYTEAKTKDE